MSAFSVVKIPRVSSVVYSLGGPEEDLPDYMKMSVLSNSLSRGPNSLGQTIVSNYLNGPGMKLRSFYRWAETHYTTVGIPRDAYRTTKELNEENLATAIATELGEPVQLKWFDQDNPDIAYWAIQWMYENLPDRAEGDDWDVEHTYGMPTATIVFTDGITASVEFPVSGFNLEKDYIYATYMLSVDPIEGPVETGVTTYIEAPDDFPDTGGWTYVSSTTTPRSQTVNTQTITTKEYSDSRPDEVTTVDDDDLIEWDDYEGVYTKTIYHGMTDGIRTSTKTDMILIQDRVLEVSDTSETSSEVIEGVTVTTTVRTIEESLVLRKSVRYDTQLLTLESWSDPKLFIYEENSGNAVLDAMFFRTNIGNGYFPVIPIRVKNHFLSETNKPEMWEQSKIAYKRIFKQDYQEIVDTIADNPQLDDIDYAYVVFGVSLNTTINAGRRYIFEYFSRIVNTYVNDDAEDYQYWIDNTFAIYQTKYEAYAQWLLQQGSIGETGSGAEPPVLEPERPVYKAPPISKVSVRSQTTDLKFNFTLEWRSIKENSGVGLSKPDAKVGDVWFDTVVLDSTEYEDVFGEDPDDELIGSILFRMWFQETENTWRRIDTIDLRHRNYVYEDKAVNNWAYEAFEDEEQSGFIVPLHNEAFRELPLNVATQLTGVCVNVVFNCYVFEKRQWYQSGAFKIIMFIVAVIITIYYPPAGVTMMVGIFGISLVLAAIIYVALTYLAAMLLTSLITDAASELFGEKVGAIVGAVVSFIVIAYTGNVANTGSWAFNLNSLLTAQNLLALTNAIGNGIAQIIMMEAKAFADEAEKYLENYSTELEDLAQKYKDVFGDGMSYIDPLSLTHAPTYSYENSHTFLNRTLLTGSDIAELATTLINSFADITLRTDLPD